MKTRVNFAVMITEEEAELFSRQMNPAILGRSGQEALKRSKVLMIGAGGLGHPALMYLAAAGIGTIGISDDDVIAVHNLHRQVLFRKSDTGRDKTGTLAARIKEINPGIDIRLHERIESSEGQTGHLKIFEDYDLILDGTDNFASKYLINDLCLQVNRPWVYASALKDELQVSVFNWRGGPCYRCLFPSFPPGSENCSTAGILGPVAGLGGCLLAAEAVKILTGRGEPLSGRLLQARLFDNFYRTVTIVKDPDCSCKQAESAGQNENQVVMEIDSEEFDRMRTRGGMLVVDVRTEKEYHQDNLGGVLIPFEEIEERWKEIPDNQPVVLHCAGGSRSKRAVELLQKIHHFSNLYSLAGGLDLYRKKKTKPFPHS